MHHCGDMALPSHSTNTRPVSSRYTPWSARHDSDSGTQGGSGTEPSGCSVPQGPAGSCSTKAVG